MKKYRFNFKYLNEVLQTHFKNGYIIKAISIEEQLHSELEETTGIGIFSGITIPMYREFWMSIKVKDTDNRWKEDSHGGKLLDIMLINIFDDKVNNLLGD